MTNNPVFDKDNESANLQKWGGVASFVLVVAMIVPPPIYLMGNLRDAYGPQTYDLADLFYGPVWAASLMTAVLALRQRTGQAGWGRMTLALLAAGLAAGMFVLAALIRSTNRQYHLMHPELGLETSTTVLIGWTTLVTGVIAAGHHFLGWALLLIGWAGWTTRSVPRALSGLYLAAGVVSLFVYRWPELEGAAGILGVVWAIWQGIVLWNSGTRRGYPI